MCFSKIKTAFISCWNKTIMSGKANFSLMRCKNADCIEVIRKNRNIYSQYKCIFLTQEVAFFTANYTSFNVGLDGKCSLAYSSIKKIMRMKFI